MNQSVVAPDFVPFADACTVAGAGVLDGVPVMGRIEGFAAEYVAAVIDEVNAI